MEKRSDRLFLRMKEITVEFISRLEREFGARGYYLPEQKPIPFAVLDLYVHPTRSLSTHVVVIAETCTWKHWGDLTVFTLSWGEALVTTWGRGPITTNPLRSPNAFHHFHGDEMLSIQPQGSGPAIFTVESRPAWRYHNMEMLELPKLAPAA
jgi:hypothetical protein